MFLFPIWAFFAGAALALVAGSLKAGRTVLSAISFVACLSAATTLIPFIFFSQPRTVGYFRDILLFRIEPATCAAGLCLSVSEAGLILWLGANYRERGLGPVFTLSLLAMGFATATIFAANALSMALCMGLTVAALLFLRKAIKTEDVKRETEDHGSSTI